MKIILKKSKHLIDFQIKKMNVFYFNEQVNVQYIIKDNHV